MNHMAETSQSLIQRTSFPIAHAQQCNQSKSNMIINSDLRVAGGHRTFFRVLVLKMLHVKASEHAPLMQDIGRVYPTSLIIKL